MGRFDDVQAPAFSTERASVVKPTPPPRVHAEQGAALRAVIATVHEAHAHRPSRPFRGKEFRDAVRHRLQVAGWICRTRVKVESRGTPDGYRGVLDLVAHPPPQRGAPALPDPVLVEFDKVSIERKTIAKLANYEGRTCGVLIVLARGSGEHGPIAGIDEILTLG